MQQTSAFQVYNASAGSGKTFTLVKEYLKVLLSSEDIFKFQKILAITFTNKAAGEMKERVLLNLEDFSKGIENDMLTTLRQEISVDKPTIQARSKKILDVILQNYSAFSITTIDSFTHKIIKNFAYDLGLSLNFEVEMDAISLLNEAVDVLISKIGSDSKLTKLLIDYTLDKTDDDKSWDISRDLNEFAKILLNEDDIKHFKELSKRKLEDFTSLKSKLFLAQNELKVAFANIGKECLALLDKNNLSQKDFTRGTIPKFFTDVSLKSFDFNFTTRSETIAKAIENHNYYTQKTPSEIAQTIENIVPQIVEFYNNLKTLYSQFLMHKLVLKNIIPLAVLNNINQELEDIKEENNIRLNAEFNQLISENIKEQPAPFIYERIGQRFQYFFIDEMQDTSVLQWQNLKPLINNALAQENSFLLLVGDAKQAIYRWRGGKAEQFIELGDQEFNPFYVSKEIKNLETNYRSYSEIINFNNSFFQHTSNFFQNESYKNLFIEGNKQLENAKKGGYVSVNFLEKLEDKEEDKLKYPKKVLEQIISIQNQFSLNEICVLTRTKKEGINIANYLTENNIAIISSETLLIQNSTKVNFIVNLLKMFQNPNDQEIRFEVLYFLHQHLKITTSKHLFLKEFVQKENESIFNDLNQFNVFFEISSFNTLPFYEKIEELIRSFGLLKTSDAYVQFFLDLVLEQQRKNTDINSFLDFWEVKKDSLSIVASESSEAVQIMTIHKSKGLEFPVVIFPSNVNLYKQLNPKVWLTDLPEDFINFKEILVDYTKSIAFVSEKGESLYNQQQEELELDSFNLLYVALTRAVEQLYIITDKKILSNGEEDKKYYSGVFINYLKHNNLWKDDVLKYTFGEEKRVSVSKKEQSIYNLQEKFISTPWQEHNMVLLASSSSLWDTAQGEAITYGNLFHEILSKIKTKEDVDKVVTQYLQQGVIDVKNTKSLIGKINELVNHLELEKYYAKDIIVYNEREIVDVDNQIIIPDRLAIINGLTTIIDYKTGSKKPEHKQQIVNYGKVLKSMGYKIEKKIIIYLNENVQLLEIS